MLVLYSTHHNYDMQVILECTGEAPENVTVTIKCNETGVIYKNTTEVEYAHTPMNITGSVSVPQYEQCNISIVFSNNNGSSKPFIKTFGECSLNATEVFLVYVYRYNSCS